MESYKLIKTYPGSPEIGTEVFVHNCKYYIHKGRFFTKGEIENNPEYWEEVTGNGYEIISFISITRHSSGDTTSIDDKGNHHWAIGGSDLWTEQELLDHEGYGTHSVKRLSDGEVFTVGDKVNFHEDYSSFKVESIKIVDGIVSLKGDIYVCSLLDPNTLKPHYS
jgi:hypothetical protein